MGGSQFRFAVYLSGMLASRWAMAAIASVTLIGLLDSLANSSEIAERAEAMGAGGATTYLIQRMPVIFDRTLLVAILLAVVLTYVSLVRRREIVALTAAGLSAFRQVVLIAPMTLLIAGLSILIVDTAMPSAVRGLQSWGAPGYSGDLLSDEDPLWIADQGRIVRIASRRGPETFGDVQIYDIGEDGAPSAITFADTATWRGDEEWELGGTRVVSLEPGAPKPSARWRSEQTPASLDRVIAEPRDLSLADMQALEQLRGSGSRPGFTYQTWFIHRLTRPLAALALVLCSVPLMQQLSRQASGDLAMIGCLALGFGYLIFDGVMLSFAEAGATKPGWAIAFPIGLFALLGVYLCLSRERPR
ncbi:LptF/LptG family permease [Parvularcula dongshanensis]|uniref:Lipopolysaccharide export system permease protein n=1 Tax=Parvularcula dongshanensis TaxID=1173995 RepID=A0A840I544_9PROT|nr:LptF/LptG family permease [Parvularcula dongshanensis]MBB4659288.1 lipopolysaccharide export system permease protein [Parvularcula dongshanensis]